MLEKDPKLRVSASKTLENKFFLEGGLDQGDDDAHTPLFLGYNVQADNDSSMFNGLNEFNSVFSRKKNKMNSLNSVDSPNRTLPVSNGPKRHTVDVLGFKQHHLHQDEEQSNASTNNSHLLVTREPIMNGQTKTVEYVGDSSQNSSDLGKLRKESLQVKIFKNPVVETCSPFLRRDLDDYKKELETENNDNKQQVISPMIIIRENEEEEEKKNDGN